jgi:hypothetical protein
MPFHNLTFGGCARRSWPGYDYHLSRECFSRPYNLPSLRSHPYWEKIGQTFGFRLYYQCFGIANITVTPGFFQTLRDITESEVTQTAGGTLDGVRRGLYALSILP